MIDSQGYVLHCCVCFRKLVVACCEFFPVLMNFEISKLIIWSDSLARLIERKLPLHNKIGNRVEGGESVT